MYRKTMFTLSLMLLMSALQGCQHGHASGDRAAADNIPATQADARQTGAQLWSQSCARCHNMRSPDNFSSAQWQVVLIHMRLRANLTGEEQRKVGEFLGIHSSRDD